MKVRLRSTSQGLFLVVQPTLVRLIDDEGHPTDISRFFDRVAEMEFKLEDVMERFVNTEVTPLTEAAVADIANDHARRGRDWSVWKVKP